MAKHLIEATGLTGTVALAIGGAFIGSLVAGWEGLFGAPIVEAVSTNRVWALLGGAVVGGVAGFVLDTLRGYLEKASHTTQR